MAAKQELTAQLDPNSIHYELHFDTMQLSIRTGLNVFQPSGRMRSYGTICFEADIDLLTGTGTFKY